MESMEAVARFENPVAELSSVLARRWRCLVVLAAASWTFACGGVESEMIRALESAAESPEHFVCAAGPLRHATVSMKPDRGDTRFLERTDQGARLLDLLEEEGFLGPAEKLPGVRFVRNEMTVHPIVAKYSDLFAAEEGILPRRAPTGELSGVCYAKRIPLEVVNYTEPANAFGQSVSRVTFRYRDELLEDGPSAEIVGLLTGVASGEAPNDEAEALLVKLNKGWKVEGIEW